jgi:hypothetical protein
VFVKLFDTMLDSSIWDEDHATVRVWITMLLMANQEGIVLASTGGVAGRARVTHQDTKNALQKFEKPDPESKNQDYGGQRIEAIDGGWRILNYQYYRELQTQRQMDDAARQRRHRAQRKAQGHGTSRDVTVTSRDVTPEAEAEAEADIKTTDTNVSEARASCGKEPASCGKNPNAAIVDVLKQYAYRPDGKPPDGWSLAQDLHVVKRDVRPANISDEEIIAFIKGVALMSDRGEIGWIQPGEKFTLKTAYKAKHGSVPLLYEAKSQWYQYENRRRVTSDRGPPRRLSASEITRGVT